MHSIFKDKYSAPTNIIQSIKTVELYSIDLDKTLLVDIKSFYDVKEFLKNDIHVFSNEAHEKFRYKNDRTVTYYGSYDYQDYDVFNYIKLNFSIFKKIIGRGTKTFITGREKYKGPSIKNSISKEHFTGYGDLFELIDTVLYVHTIEDTNNRIIPEAFHYNKKIVIEDKSPELIDSITLRYNDIMNNGLENYTLSDSDEMVKACQKYAN